MSYNHVIIEGFYTVVDHEFYFLNGNKHGS